MEQKKKNKEKFVILLFLYALKICFLIECNFVNKIGFNAITPFWLGLNFEAIFVSTSIILWIDFMNKQHCIIAWKKQPSHKNKLSECKNKKNEFVYTLSSFHSLPQKNINKIDIGT